MGEQSCRATFILTIFIYMQNFSRHLKEAISLNLERMPKYAALTNNKSIPFSEKLIRSEKTALLGSWIFDWKGDKLQAKGVPYMKEEFVEMSLVPDFSSHYPKEIDFEISLRKLEVKSLIKNLKQQLSDRNFDKLALLSKAFIEENLDSQPHVYCMLRHMLESMWQISTLVPVQAERCLKLALKVPTNYSILLLKAHIWKLEEARGMDEEIAPIQLAGVPFLFQDLPKIAIS